MIEFLESITPYLKGLWTLPWILIGFIITILLAHVFGEKKIDRVMKKTGLVILYIFVPALLFRIFLSVDFYAAEIIFALLCVVTLTLMYLLAFVVAKHNIKRVPFTKQQSSQYLKTVLANQGRSSAFVGGAMLAIAEWRIPAAIYMSIGAVFLFAIIPYLLSYLHFKETTTGKEHEKIQALPAYLRIFPWYLLGVAVLAVILHGSFAISLTTFDPDAGVLIDFFTSLTIPMALYYVGAGIHPHDLRKTQLTQLFRRTQDHKSDSPWLWIRHIVFITVLLTPILTIVLFTGLLLTHLIPTAWFSVMIINSFLPITSTNLFLVPYGIDKKVTALSVTWTTVIGIPLVVILITVFNLIFN